MAPPGGVTPWRHQVAQHRGAARWRYTVAPPVGATQWRCQVALHRGADSRRCIVALPDDAISWRSHAELHIVVSPAGVAHSSVTKRGYTIS